MVRIPVEVTLVLEDEEHSGNSQMQAVGGGEVVLVPVVGANPRKRGSAGVPEVEGGQEEEACRGSHLDGTVVSMLVEGAQTGAGELQVPADPGWLGQKQVGSSCITVINLMEN